MATTQAFLKEAVLQNRFIKPGVVKVVMHDAGPLQDGSVVKEVADNTVYMKAIFTPQSLDDFNTSFEDSFNSPPEWNQALLLLNQFRVEFQSAFAPTNTERKPRFVLVIERFGLYNLHEGFYSKNEPKYVMADQEVQAKAEEMEKELLDRRREEAVETETESQNPSDVPLSVLLELMGQSSIADLTPVVSQCEEEECTDEREPSGSDLNIAHMLPSALEKMRCLNCEEFVVSAEDQAVLDAILEWKDDYIPPSSESSEEQQSKPSMGASLDVMFENPTLRHDIGRIPDPPSSVTTSQHKTKRGADCMQAEEITEGNEPSASAHKGTNSNAATPCVTPVDSQAVTVEESAGAQDYTEAGKGLDDRGIPKSVASSAQCWSRANQQAPDSSDTSKSSADCSTNHPDVAFSSSSLSNLGDHSSSMEGAPTSLSASAACLPSAEPSGATQAEGDSELHDGQHVQPGHINANIVSVDKGQEVTSSCLASEPVSVENGNLDAEKRSFVKISETDSPRQAEPVVRTESGAVRVTRSTEDCFASETNVQVQESSPEEVQSSSMVPAVLFSCVAQSQGNSDNAVSQGFVVPSDDQVSGGFVPSDITSQDWLSSGSVHIDTQDRNATHIGDSMPVTQSFIPSDIPTQELIPNDSLVEETNRAEKGRDERRDEHLGTNAVNPVCAPKQTFRGKRGHSTVTGNKTYTVVEKSHTTESSLSHIHCEHSFLKENQPDTQNEEENVCPDSVGESPQHRIYHSTQNTSTDGSQSPSVLEISAIPHSNNAEDRNSVPAPKPSKPHQTKRKETETRREREKKRGVPISPKSGKKKPTTGPPAKISKHSDIHHKSTENTKPCKVLVGCSGSSDSEDAFDRELMQQVNGQRSARNPAPDHPGSSGETVVVPDSSQEDVIVISSSSGNSIQEVHHGSSDREQLTVGELLDLVEKTPEKRKRDPLNFVNSASTQTTKTCNEVSCPVSPSRKSVHESRTKQSFAARDKEFQRNTSTHTDTQRRKTVNTQYRNPLNENAQEEDSSHRSNDHRIQRSGQIHGQGGNHVSMIDRDKRTMATSTVVENSSVSDEIPPEKYDEHRAMSPSRKRFNPWDSNHALFHKRPRQKECAQVCSDSSVSRSAISGGSRVGSSERLGGKNTHPKTLSVCDSHRSSSEHTVNRRTESTFIGRQQTVMDNFGRLHPSRASVKASHSKETNSGSVSSTHAQVHAQACRRLISSSHSVSKASSSRQNVSTEESDSSTNEEEDTSTGGTFRNRVISNKLTAYITARNQPNKRHSTNFQFQNIHASPHCSTSTNHSPFAGRMNTSQNKGSEKDDRYVRNDQTTTSSKHAHNDKAKTVSSPSASRNTTPVYVRQEQLESSSETEEEEAVTETESSTEDLADCMRTNFRAWLEYTSRLEDPKQKRLRQLKLTQDVLKKVEECLGT